MQRILISTAIALSLFGTLASVMYGQSATETLTADARAGTVFAVVENTSNRNVLIFAESFGPKSLLDVAKFHVGPHMKSSLKVTVPANGRVKFVASAGSAGDKNDFIGQIIGTCTWRQEPNATTKVPYVLYNGVALTCGNTTR